MLGDMLAAMSQPNTGDRGLSHVVVDGHLRMSVVVVSSDRSNLIVHQGYVSSGFGPSALSVHVREIDSLGPQEEVVGSDAGWIIAGVQHVKALGDQPIGPYPRQFVSADGLSLVPKKPVVFSSLVVGTRLGENSRPHPTGVGLVDSGPEAGLIVSEDQDRPTLATTRSLGWTETQEALGTNGAYGGVLRLDGCHYATSHPQYMPLELE